MAKCALPMKNVISLELSPETALDALSGSWFRSGNRKAQISLFCVTATAMPGLQLLGRREAGVCHVSLCALVEHHTPRTWRSPELGEGREGRASRVESRETTRAGVPYDFNYFVLKKQQQKNKQLKILMSILRISCGKFA